MNIGAHLSIAGGLHRAIESAARLHFRTVAMFLRNQQQWKAPALTDEAVRTFREVHRRLGISPVVAHASYLVNLAGNADVRGRSIAAMIDDMDRCRRLGIDHLVVHPGSCPDESAGLALVTEALNEILAAAPGAHTQILLETTAGSGHTLGWRFEQLGDMLRRVDRPCRVGVCLDTCHVFAAGYDFRRREDYSAMMARFDDAVGPKRLAVIHLNDSVGPAGCRVDRHTHIGHGQIGREGFRHLMNDDRLSSTAMILETPKGLRPSDGRDWDAVNAAVLRRLVGREKTLGAEISGGRRRTVHRGKV